MLLKYGGEYFFFTYAFWLLQKFWGRRYIFTGLTQKAEKGRAEARPFHYPFVFLFLHVFGHIARLFGQYCHAYHAHDGQNHHAE